MKRFLLIIPLLIALISCSVNRYSTTVEDVLHSAGKNRSELKKAIRYFENKGDSLQLNAALFLIENMDEHCYVSVTACDSNKTDIPWNIRDYANFQEAQCAMDSLEKEHGSFMWKLEERREDVNAMSADFLIHNVEDAFSAWQNLPWAKGYSYDIFLKYILPYRGSNEPLPESATWRLEFMEKYKEIASQ
ncbi:MAG TPA: hypothetical protein PLD62_11130, partial [Candidatus Cloacimonadota bacterium]|nr:hypothetical protein [Candidatus Cloacimonadota bacterium]